MLAGIFHSGSGCGDQLHRYITVRTLAEEKGYEWGMKDSMFFKGKSFMDIKFSSRFDSLPTKEWKEKEVRDAQGNDIRSYDPEVNFVQDNTTIDGSFEDSKYWGHNLTNINKWLEVEPLTVPDDMCILGFRGAEYATVPELFLPRVYYQEAMGKIGLKKYQVHTDDPQLARSMLSFGFSKYLDSFEIVENQQLGHSLHSNMGFNWRSARFAKYAIIPNSAFFILPRLLKHHEDPEAVTIAPRWWSRRNTKGPWRPAAYYKPFTYV
jgi:hypothetical protein